MQAGTLGTKQRAAATVDAKFVELDALLHERLSHRRIDSVYGGDVCRSQRIGEHSHPYAAVDQARETFDGSCARYEEVKAAARLTALRVVKTRLALFSWVGPPRVRNIS
jgi:hypothetical protein